MLVYQNHRLSGLMFATILPHTCGNKDSGPVREYGYLVH